MDLKMKMKKKNLRKIEKKKPNIKIRVLSWEDQIVPFLKNNQ